MDDKKNSKEKSKVGHRRVTDEGTVTYKRKTTSEIQQAIQIGIRTTVLSAHNKAKRDMLLKDFGVVETLAFPKVGSKDTSPHNLSDFKFKTFAPIAFRYFRDFFEVDIGDYLNSLCHQELHELVNAGASGSIFYITMDDEFIIKTVQHKEASFLQKLLPEYYINLMQHPRTLLPKFYGLYCYQTMGKNIRFVVMNNLVPSIKIHEKYDLKGSTYKRIAGVTEKSKPSPTLKDLDFRDNHPDGIVLEVETYEALLNTIQRDCRVLESFRIMDYSLLLGIHNLDVNNEGQRKKNELNAKKHSSEPLTNDMSVFDDKHFQEDGDEIAAQMDKSDDMVIVLQNSEEDGHEHDKKHNHLLDSKSDSSAYYTPPIVDPTTTTSHTGDNNTQPPSASTSTNQGNTGSVIIRRPLNRQTSKNKSMRRIAAFSTVLESIQAPVEMFDMNNEDTENIPAGGIPARNKLGDRLILFMGIIDILQSYGLMKRLEHNMKAIFLDAETISVTNPNFYGLRFQEFFGNIVFKKIPSLDQPQMLGNHARRFRNFVHLAMRQQQPDKNAPLFLANAASASMDSHEDPVKSEAETARLGSDETMVTETEANEESKAKSHVSFPNIIHSSE